VTAGGLEFDAVYEAYRPRIQRYLTRLVGEVDAEDLTQEVFVRVDRGLKDFRGESQLSTWLYRIATHAAIDRMRMPAFRAEACQVPFEESDEVAASAGLWNREETLLPEQLVFLQERFRCFLGFLRDLPSTYRAVFVLSDLELLGNREIAEVLGLSLETVKIRLHRARVRLFQELRAHCKPEEWL
jgi:RNA polymerase sigma-70 factor (ECF subfamily)